MTSTTLPTVLRAEALGEIMSFQMKLFQSVCGELPSGDAMEVIAKAADSWLEKLVRLLMPPAYYLAPEFKEVESDELKKTLFNTWLKAWYDTYVLRAQLFGLTEKTARAVVDHLHGRTA